MPASKLSEGKIPVPGGNVSWRALGEGPKTPLLVLHGGPGFPSDYLTSLAALGDERRIYFYDQLGAGQSDRPQDPSLWVRERFVGELVAVRAALGLEQMHLLGHSWGTMLAAEYVFTASPQELRSVTFASPCLSASRFAADIRKLIATLPADARSAIAEAERTGDFAAKAYEEANAAFMALYLTRRGLGTPALEKAFAEFNLDCYGTMWGPSEFTIRGNLKDFERASDLARLAVPSLFFCGAFDECTPETTRWQASLAPGSEFAVIPGAAHLTTIDEPEATVALVRAFLARVERDRR